MRESGQPERSEGIAIANGLNERSSVNQGARMKNSRDCCSRSILFVAVCLVVTSPLVLGGDLSVREIGSMHFGGRQVTLSGLPTKEVVFTAGGPAVKVDPNGDFEVEQMYVQYVKLTSPKAK